MVAEPGRCTVAACPCAGTLGRPAIALGEPGPQDSHCCLVVGVLRARPGAHGGDAALNVPDPHRRLRHVAVLPARPRASEHVDAHGLASDRRCLDRGGLLERFHRDERRVAPPAPASDPPQVRDAVHAVLGVPALARAGVHAERRAARPGVGVLRVEQRVAGSRALRVPHVHAQQPCRERLRVAPARACAHGEDDGAWGGSGRPIRSCTFPGSFLELVGVALDVVEQRRVVDSRAQREQGELLAGLSRARLRSAALRRRPRRCATGA